jgi:hypothetical protein
MLTITTDVPTGEDEYRREEQGTWTRDLKWHRRMFAYKPSWYFNWLIALCALFWLFSLIPGAFSAFNFTFVALKSVATSLAFMLSVAARWMRELELKIMLDYRAPRALLSSLM